MKLNNEKQIFNLMDTNGRRNDVTNALQGYLSILSGLNGEWDNLPNSLSQYLFYKKENNNRKKSSEYTKTINYTSYYFFKTVIYLGNTNSVR